MGLVEVAVVGPHTALVDTLPNPTSAIGEMVSVLETRTLVWAASVSVWALEATTFL